MTHSIRFILLLMLGMASLGAGETTAQDHEPAPAAEEAARGERPAVPAPRSILTGTLVSARDLEPVAGGRVMALLDRDPETKREMMLAGARMGEPIAESAAGDDGRFRLVVPPSLQVIIVAEAPDHARGRLEKVHYTGQAAIEKAIGRIELKPGRQVTGKVISWERPVAGATVIAVPERVSAPSRPAGGLILPRQTELQPFPVIGRTDDKGMFRLTGLPRKPVSLRVFADGLAPGLARGAGASSSLVVHLGNGVALEGRVVGPDGRTPTAGAWVLAGEDGWDGITRTGADGSFRLENLRPGSLDLTAVSAGTGPVIVDGEPGPIPAPSAPVSIVAPAAPESPPALLRLRPGGVIVARTVDARTRRPIAGARLSMSYSSQVSPWDAVTGDGGQVVYMGVPAERVALYAEADGYLEEYLDPRPLAPGQRQTMSIALRPAAALEGIVRDESGRPLSGARVMVSGKPRLSLPVPVSIFVPIGVDPVLSDLKGLFSIEKLPPGEELKIRVTLSGYGPWELENVELRPGERRGDLEVLLDRGGTISGRLGTLDGHPVTLAEITATRIPEGTGRAIMIRSGSGEIENKSLPAVAPAMDGTFRVSGVSPGLWSLEIRAQGFAPRKLKGLSIEDSSGLDLGDVVMTPGAVLSGEVVASTGEPIPFAEGNVLREFEPVSTFVTEGDGTFSTDDLAPGELVTLTITAPSYATFKRAGLEPPMEDLLVTMSPSSSIHGEVMERGTDDPVTDFSISVSSTHSGTAAGMQMTMLAQGPDMSFHSEDGTFTLEDIDPGKINLTASAPGYKETMLRDLVVPEGADLEEVVLVLERGAIVSGTVFDDAGRPLSGVDVSRQETSRKPGMMSIDMGGGSEARTDGDGAFLMDGLDRGEMTIAFEYPGFETAQRDVDTSISDVEGLRVTMSRGAVLSGIVMHEENGSPVAGAMVSASIAGGSSRGSTHSDTTGSDGSFAMEGVTQGRYTLRAEASGLTPGTVEDVIVTEGVSPPPIEIALGGGVTLLGTVIGLPEAEMPGITVRAVGAGGGFGVTAPVDGGGRFEVKGMNPGSVTLFASSGFMSGRSVTKTTEIPEGAATHEVTLEFPGGRTVEGIVSIGGAPLDGASVHFMNKATRARSSATADSSGRYIARDIEDGDYEVNVLAFARGVSHRTETSVDSDMQFDIDVPSAMIRGWVTETGTEDPLAGVLVTAERTDGESSGFKSMGSSDTSGYYEIAGLQDGAYDVIASKSGYGFENETVNLSAERSFEEVSFELSSGATFRFTAIDIRSGTPLGNLDAMVLGGPLPTALTADASGVFSISSLQPGSYRLVLGGANLATEIDDIVVPGPEEQYHMVPGDILTVQVDGLQPGAIARGHILDLNGNDYYVSVSSPDPTFIIRGGQQAPAFRVKLGNYTVRVTMPDGTVHQSQVTVTGPSLVVLP